MTYLRSASLRGFRTITGELGGDADALVAAVRLPRDCLDHDDLLVPATRAAALLELAAERLDCPDLGLRMARMQSVSVLGPLAVAMTNSPTIGEALASLTRYLSVHGRVLRLRLDDDPRGNPDITALYYGPADTGGPMQAVDLGVGFIHRVIAYLNNGPYPLRSVELPYTPPAPLEDYRAFFDATVRVGQPYPAAILRLPADLPGKPLVGVNETLRELAVAFLAEQTASRGADVASLVRTAVHESLGTGPVRLSGIARLMHVHPRTLQRQLAAAETNFAQVVDDVRREMALRLLVGTDLPVGQIAAMVGFEEQPSLNRAARRWWNATPVDVRDGR